MLENKTEMKHAAQYGRNEQINPKKRKEMANNVGRHLAKLVKENKIHRIQAKCFLVLSALTRHPLILVKESLYSPGSTCCTYGSGLAHLASHPILPVQPAALAQERASDPRRPNGLP